MTTEKLEWKIREIRQSDIPQLCALTELVFNRPMSEVQWNWQFRDNPAGYCRALVAHVGDQIVGQYMVIPMELCLEGRTILASLSMDTMTHPTYRKQGIFQTLALKLYADLAKDGISITYGFPNENSLSGLTNLLGWSHIATLNMYVKPLNVERFIQKGKGGRFLAFIAARPLSFFFRQSSAPPSSLGLKVRQVDRFDERVDNLWQMNRTIQPIQKSRTRDFLNWRYADCPFRDYQFFILEEKEQLLGYIVLRYMEEFGLKGGMIVDFLVHPKRPEAFEALVSACLYYSTEQEMDLVACILHGNRALLKRLQKLRFIKVPRFLEPKKWYFTVRQNNTRYSADLINSPHSWFLTFGDTDVI